MPDPQYEERTLLIAGVPVAVAHRYPLSAWVCAGHETDQPTRFAVSATDAELAAERDRLEGRFGPDACEANCLYRKAALGMLADDGFLLHAAAVAVDGWGYVFTAPSGTGKSTHAGFWLREFGPRAVMINGDKPILRRVDGRFYVCGTPWRGKERLGTAEGVPLRAVCLLERGAENAVAPADTDAVLDKIFRQVLLPDEPEAIVRQLDLLDALLRAVPAYALRCNLSPDAARAAYDGMNRT
ncbi:MAG: hypothetical protein LJU34_03345 [Oscillospiraceae bacterium]|nr:hypothetical protein [Oscillospiraceae bacterium]